MPVLLITPGSQLDGVPLEATSAMDLSLLYKMAPIREVTKQDHTFILKYRLPRKKIRGNFANLNGLGRVQTRPSSAGVPSSILE
jgi:hypothetical protein